MAQTYIIAEAGVNHNGSLEMACQLVDAAVEAGVNAVKFQTFKAKKLVTHYAQTAEYQRRFTGENSSQFEMLRKLELDETSHFKLFAYCEEKGIEFLSTPFDEESVTFLAEKLHVIKFKVSSGDLTNGPLLNKLAGYRKPIILSTGMSTLAEIEDALGLLAFSYTNGEKEDCSLNAFQKAYCSKEGQEALAKYVTLLHCTTEYPAPFTEVHLRVMRTLREAFQLPVGFSDHTKGIAVPIAAVALGATIVEKHFTLSRSLPGPDHAASLEPKELKEMVQSIRQVEVSMGASLKQPTPSEMKNKGFARKSIVASRPIQAGEVLTSENMSTKRPGDGISPMKYWELIGKTAKRTYDTDEKIQE